MKRMSLKVADQGRETLTYQLPNQKVPVSRTFYSSGGYVFEDLPKGDRCMTFTLNACEGSQPAISATRETLPEVLPREYYRLKDYQKRRKEHEVINSS